MEPNLRAGWPVRAGGYAERWRRRNANLCFWITASYLTTLIIASRLHLLSATQGLLAALGGWIAVMASYFGYSAWVADRFVRAKLEPCWRSASMHYDVDYQDNWYGKSSILTWVVAVSLLLGFITLGYPQPLIDDLTSLWLVAGGCTTPLILLMLARPRYQLRFVATWWQMMQMIKKGWDCLLFWFFGEPAGLLSDDPSTWPQQEECSQTEPEIMPPTRMTDQLDNSDSICSDQLY